MLTLRGEASQGDWERVTDKVRRQGEKPGQCDATTHGKKSFHRGG